MKTETPKGGRSYPARRRRRILPALGALAALGAYAGFSSAAARSAPRKAEGPAGLVYMLGPIRPVLVDLLWLDAVNSQEEGRFYDAHMAALSLAELQPHFDAVWGFIGWNLAYNVSWDHPEPKDRFFWIREAVRLLEDRGLRNNPGSLLILQELGFIHYHRLSPLGQDPFADYFQEWLSPPADWLEEKGFEYTGLSVEMKRGELRLYTPSSGRPLRKVELGPYYGPATHRPPLPPAVFWKPADNQSPGDLERLRAGVMLLGDPGSEAVRWPPELDGSFILAVGKKEFEKGFRKELPGEGRVFVGFLPDRYECFRRAARYFAGALGSPDARGMAGLNVGRMLAHSYEKMGLFEEAAEVWDVLPKRFPRLKPKMEDGIRNFYHRVIYFYRNDPAKQLEWYGRLRERIPESLTPKEIVREVERDFQQE